MTTSSPPTPDPAGIGSPPPPPPSRPDPPPLAVSRLWWVTGPVMIALLGAIVVVLGRPVPYLALTPGSARSVEPLVTISQVPDGPKLRLEEPGDDLLFVTVSVRRPSGIEALYRLLDDTDEVVPEKVVNGDQSPEETRTFNLQLMTDSKDKATKVALERAGYRVTVKSDGAVVVDLDPSYPVADVVRPGDTIVEADGTPVATTRDLVAVIAKHQPGDRLRLRVEPFGNSKSRTVETKLAKNPKTGKAQLGVSLEPRPVYTFPVRVSIDSGRVGGPSAGLAFTLAILDRLTPGALTGDRPVAVTGTIDLEGRVGPVGGVVQKTEAAIEAGAELFIVPPDEFADARRVARGRLQIEKASTLDQALRVLERFGGDRVTPVADAETGAAGSSSALGD